MVNYVCVKTVPDSTKLRLINSPYSRGTCPQPSLVPRPPPQLLSLAIRITRRRPDENYHVMYPTVYVTDSNYSIL